jgi:hypothetical protein
MYLARQGKRWQRTLLHLANAHDLGKVSDWLIADTLARLNYEAYRKVGDGTVGPRCVVVWRRRPDARRPVSGGGLQFYTGIDRDPSSDMIPTIINGMDLRSVVGLLIKHVSSRFTQAEYGANSALESDTVEINRQLAQLPSRPDEELR